MAYKLLILLLCFGLASVQGTELQLRLGRPKRRFVLGRQARVILEMPEESSVSAASAALGMGSDMEDMYAAMFDETWPPLPPSPPPEGPPTPMDRDQSGNVAALEAPGQSAGPTPPKKQWGKKHPPSPPKKWGKRPPSPPYPPSPPLPPSPPVPPEPPMPPEETDDPQVVGDYSQVGVGNIVAVHMVHIPGTNKFFFMERPSGKHPDKSWAIAGYWDQDRLNFTNVLATDSLFCAGHTLTAQGDILVVGGHIAKSGYGDGLKGLRLFNRTSLELTRLGELLAPRWYPSATLLENGVIFIVGGTIKPGSGTGITSYYELWDPANPHTTTPKQLSKQFVSRTFDIYYPNNYLLPDGHLFMYCNTYGEIIDPMKGTTRAVIPPLGANLKINTEYPYTGTSVMLPLYPENAYGVEIVYFGGQYSYGYVNTTASDQAWRLGLTIQSNGEYDFNDGWYPETMLSPRVMPDTVLLPNGQIVILNGARRGMAGDNIKGGRAKCNEPNFYPELYTPKAMYGKRFTKLKRNLIPRLYHSTAALTEDGTVLVAGCDRCANFWTLDRRMSPSPWGLSEYRIELLRPPVWFDFTSKPVIDWSDSETLMYDRPLMLTYHMFDMTMVADRAVLVAPSSTTHSTNMHQRVVGLRIQANDPVDDSYNMTVLGPERPALAPPGMYMLFLLNGDVYSRSMWVTLCHPPTNKRQRHM